MEIISKLYQNREHRYNLVLGIQIGIQIGLKSTIDNYTSGTVKAIARAN